MIDIYYVEDDENIARIVKEYLEQRSCRVSVFHTIAAAQKAFEGHVPAAALVDWNMPDGRGDSLCRWIRSRWKELPLIFLTVRGDSRDIVSGFENGADDYVVKPFSPKELMMRVKVVIDRNGGRDSASTNGHEIFQAEGLVIDFTGRTVTVDGKRAELSPKEYDLLFYLVRNRNIALEREKLITEVWGYDYYGDDRTLDTHIKLLRSSLGDYRKFLVTLRGVGYRFEA